MHIPGAPGCVLCRFGETRELLQQRIKLIQSEICAHGNVERPSTDAPRRGVAGQQVCRDHILDESKIPGLGPVAKNSGLLSIQHESNKFWNHCSIERAGMLARSKHIEVAQAYSLESQHLA